MQKPNGYDEAKASGDFTPVEVGGHYAVIKRVEEVKSKTGKPMIVVLFDLANNDKQPSYFTDAFKADIREEKKWPFNGTKYIMVNDYMDSSKTSKNFKTFCTCVENSNNYEVKWTGENWGKQFVGKKIGVVFGEEENEYNGKTFMRSVPKWFCTYDKVESAKIPTPKHLDKKPISSAADNFVSIPEGVDEEIPF